jgi:hypothetical protein
MIVFGGNDGARSNQVWTLSSLQSSPTWTQLTPLGTPPSPREHHSAVYDPVGARMIVFGGYDGALLNDVWALSLTDPPTWTPLTTSGTPPTAPRRQRRLRLAAAAALVRRAAPMPNALTLDRECAGPARHQCGSA